TADPLAAQTPPAPRRRRGRPRHGCAPAAMRAPPPAHAPASVGRPAVAAPWAAPNASACLHLRQGSPHAAAATKGSDRKESCAGFLTPGNSGQNGIIRQSRRRVESDLYDEPCLPAIAAGSNVVTPSNTALPPGDPPGLHAG